MNKITHYEVVSMELDGFPMGNPKSEKTFANIVNEKIKAGLQPFGELKISVESSGSFISSGSTTRLSQVMVKYYEVI